MKTIIFFNTNKAWGGGEKWHYNTALSLIQKKYKCFFITYPASELEKKLIKDNIPYYSLRVNNLSFLNIKKRIKLKALLQKLSPDAIFMNLPSDVKICAPIAASLGVKKIIYRRGMPHPLKKSFINKLVYQRVTHFMANSQTVADSLSKNFSWIANKTHIIYNSSQVQRVPKELNFSKLTLGNLARLVEQKGQKYLIDLARELAKRDLAFEILIAGEGPLKEKLQESIIENNLSNYVKLLGHVKPSDFFDKIQLFIFPSLFEGMPNALIEAYSYGIPAVAFETSSMPEVITDNVDGFLIKPFNISLMADRIEECIYSPQKIFKMGEKANLKIEKKFNTNVILKKIEDLINEE